MPKVEVTDAKGLVQSSGTGVKLNAAFATGYQTIAAAGTIQGDATAIVVADGSLVGVTASNATKGVRLPALADVEVGHVIVIVDLQGAVLKVWPAVGDKVSPIADNTHVPVAANSGLILFKADATQWLGLEPAAIAA